MRTIRWSFLLVGLTCVSAMGFAQTGKPAKTLKQQEQLASSMLSRVNLSFGSGKVETAISSPRGLGKLVSIGSEEVTVFLDGETQDLRGIFNFAKEDDIRKGRGRTYQRFYSNGKAAWSKGDKILADLGIKRSDLIATGMKLHPDSPSTNDALKGQLILTYESKPFGHRTYGDGNSITLTLDPQDGSILRLIRNTGWTYGRPLVKINQTRATQIATQIAAKYGVPAGNATVELRYALSDKSFGSRRGEQLRQQKIVRLSYSVNFPKTTILVDAETGECLGGSTRRVR